MFTYIVVVVVACEYTVHCIGAGSHVNHRESILRRGALACTVPLEWLELPD